MCNLGAHFQTAHLFFLTNRPLFFLDFIERYRSKLPSSFQTKQPHPVKESVYLSSEYVPQLLKSLAAEKHSIYGAVSFTIATETHSDLFTFGISHVCDRPGSFFMNIAPELKLFKDVFLKRHASLIDPLMKEGLFFPKNKPANDLNRFRGSHGFFTLDEKEALLMRHLIAGDTIDTICDAMKISLFEACYSTDLLLRKIDQPLHAIECCA